MTGGKTWVQERVAWIGVSGYVYRHWKGTFYPEGLPQRRWLEFTAQHFNSIELNGTFYSLKSPAIFQRWAEETPDNFLFAVKGGRYLTHRLKLKNCRQALANFFASGVLALGRKTGPFLWQLPEAFRFNPERIETFLKMLPRDTDAAASLAAEHDDKLKRGALTEASIRQRLRHALEVRHASYHVPVFYELLRRYDVACVIADTAGRFLYSEEVTTDFVYVRLHGSQMLYASQYNDDELVEWARRIQRWEQEGREVYLYFDNDAHGYAPADALRLADRLAL